MPIGEEAERYRLTIAPASGPSRTVETEAPAYHYPAADVAADLSLGGTVTLTVAHAGSFATSRAAGIIVSID